MLRIRAFTEADIELGMRLKSAAGWNQLPADWRRMIAFQPDGCFLAEWNRTPVGTTVAVVFGPVAWLAMVLVDETYRGRGIGQALVEHALQFVDARGATSVRLDATPLGQPLYERLGFVAQFELTRFAGRVAIQSENRKGADGLSDDKSILREQIVALDERVTHTQRGKFLSRLMDEQPAGTRVVVSGGEFAGYLLFRPGSQATQIGPCIADEAAGPLLIADAVQGLEGKQVYVDIPAQNSAASEMARAASLAAARTLVRMCRGHVVREEDGWLWASSGPELG
jgi:GNAT superfamily N-acetyltransferase